MITSARIFAQAIRSASLILLLVSASALTSCGRRVPGPTTPSITLVVTNRGYFDVNVYALRSPLTNGIRLGTVTGGSTQTFRVKETELRPGGLMALGVRAIAGRSSWTSPELSVNLGTIARLDVYSTSNGDLSQSQFYTQ